MITVQQLKNILAQVPDDAVVVGSDPDFKNFETTGCQLIRNFTGSPFDGQKVFFIDIKPL